MITIEREEERGIWHLSVFWKIIKISQRILISWFSLAKTNFVYKIRYDICRTHM